jgi:hypothetical protein
MTLAAMCWVMHSLPTIQTDVYFERESRQERPFDMALKRVLEG